MIIHLLCLLLFSGFIHGRFDGHGEYCSISKAWDCRIRLIGTADVPQPIRNVSRQIRDQLELQFAYQIPADAFSGQLFVANILKWRLGKELIKEKRIEFWIRIEEIDPKPMAARFLKIEAVRGDQAKRALPLPYTEFVAALERRFDLGKNYRLSVIHQTFSAGNEQILASTTLISIAGLGDFKDDDRVVCSDQHIAKTRKLAGRWVTGIRTRLFPVHELVNVSFFAAPKQFCIDQYELKLFKLVFDNKQLVHTQIVPEEKLVKNGSNGIGHVVFTGLKQGFSYVITVKPLEQRRNSSTCVCRVSSTCDCVLALSRPFEMPAIGDSVLEKFIGAKYSEAKILKPSFPSAEPENDDFPWQILSMVVVVLIAAALLPITCLVCRKKYHWTQQSKVLIKTNANPSLDSKPLIKPRKTTRLFVLDADDSKSRFIEGLVEIFKTNGFIVNYAPLDVEKVEANTFHYVHKSICDSDKILLFHSKKTENFIQKNETRFDAVFDSVYFIALSMLTLNDPKIIHIKFGNDEMEAKMHFAETMLQFPRDVRYLLEHCRIQVDQTSLDKLDLLLNPAETEPEMIPTLISDLPEKSEDKLDSSIEDSASTVSLRSVSTEKEEPDSGIALSPLMVPLTVDAKAEYLMNSSIDSGVHTFEVC